MPFTASTGGLPGQVRVNWRHSIAYVIGNSVSKQTGQLPITDSPAMDQNYNELFPAAAANFTEFTPRLVLSGTVSRS
jgi:cytochrome c1